MRVSSPLGFSLGFVFLSSKLFSELRFGFTQNSPLEKKQQNRFFIQFRFYRETLIKSTGNHAYEFNVFFFISLFCVPSSIDDDRADTCNAHILCSLSIVREGWREIFRSESKSKNHENVFSFLFTCKFSILDDEGKSLLGAGEFYFHILSWVHLNIFLLASLQLHVLCSGKIKFKQECHKNSFILAAVVAFTTLGKETNTTW